MDPHAQALVQRLQRNPDDADAYSALRAHYHRLGDYASLANLLEGWAARAADVNGAANAYFEAAELCEGYLDDRPRAINLLERSLEKNPLHPESSARLEEIFEAAGDYRRLIDLIESRAESLLTTHADPRHAAALYQQMGELWEQRLGRVDRAINHYRKAFELDGTLVTAIYAAREIYRDAGNLKAASSLYDLEVGAEADPQRKVALLREVAHLRAEQLGDLEGAIQALKRAQTQAPTDLSVMHDQATVLLKRADQLSDEHSASLDRQKAADLLFQMAQGVPPDHGLAYAEAALDAAPDHDGALELLERIAKDTGRPDVLPIRWVAYLQAAPNSPTTDRMRRRLGEAYVEADQLEDAIVCYEPLLERGDSEVAESLVDLYRRAGRERDVVRALSVAVAGLPVDKRVPRLREIITILVGQGELGGARERAREILQIDAADPEALAFLEGDCRDRGAFAELRDLLLAAGRVPGLSADARKIRLSEVASLSENKLGDVEGAISAWRAITTLDPADGPARQRLATLLEETGRWDELVQVLERETLSVTDPEDKADLHGRLARIHRTHRQSLGEAIEAYRALREIRPGDDDARDELCDTLVEAGAFLEAVPLLRQRIEEATLSEDRVTLLQRLGDILFDQVGDDEAAFEVATRLLDESPGHEPALDRMQQIDRRAARWDRLLSTLSYRSEMAPPESRADILVEMAQVADESLGDLDRAAEYYGQVVDISPNYEGALDALCSVYDRSSRFRDLVVLLRERAQDETDPITRGELYRRIARTMATRVRNEDAAAEAYRELLASGEDEEALRFLCRHAEKGGDYRSLTDFLARLSAIVDAEDERRDLLLDQAQVLADELGDDEAALTVLTDIIERLDPNHLGALGRMAALAEKVGNLSKLSMALERQLAITEDDGLRVPISRRLADLYEEDLDDAPRAIEALTHWANADLMESAPHRRLLPLLEAADRHEELLASLDTLAGIEQEREVISGYVQRAARVCVDRLGDVDGAWRRLTEHAAEGDGECEKALRDLAREVARGEALAQFYVGRAQGTPDAEEQRRHWLSASLVLESYLDDAGRALEATLRAFATNLDDSSLLDDVDRLGETANAWPRVTQVYDTLLGRAPDEATKVGLLVRLSHLLDTKASDPSGALDRILRACSLAVHDDTVLELAEDLAPRAGRAEELFIVYDRRRASAVDDAGRVAALLRSASLADDALADRTRALGLVQQAVLASKSPELLGVIEGVMREFDDLRPAHGPGAAQRALVGIYQDLAEKVAEDAPAASAVMLRRAAQMHLDDLDDRSSALRLLVQATTYAPGDSAILDELETLSEQDGHLDAFQKHLEGLVAEALDQGTAAALLKRRGRVLEVELERFSEAADVFTRLASLRREDSQVAPRLKHCLRKAARHQDLLLVLEKEASRAESQTKIELYREVAGVWEHDLGNRWEAIDAWKRVLAEDPHAEDAEDAVGRLQHSTRRLGADDLEPGDRPVPAEEPAPVENEDASFTAPAILAPTGSRMEFEDETDLETSDDFLEDLEPALRSALEESVPTIEGDAAPAAPALADALDFDTGDVTAPHTKAEMTDSPETAELDISEIEEAPGFAEEELSLDTGEIDLLAIQEDDGDDGEVERGEDHLGIEELDADALLEDTGPVSTASVPPPPPPPRSRSGRPPPPPPARSTSTAPPPLPGSNDD